MRQLRRGLDHVAHLDGDLVVRVVQDQRNAGEVEREAALLAVVASISPLPVPRPVRVDPQRGSLTYERLPGVPLMDLDGFRRAEAAASVGRELGALLRALHELEHGGVEALVEIDDDGLDSWVEEARRNHDAVASAIPALHADAVHRFLVSAPPPRDTALVFTHNDLGIEHVLVDPETLDVTGVIDWSDAALADPARDFGLILRDLGPLGLDASLRAYGHDAADFVPRVRFYARCKLLEDMAYGAATGRDEYVAGSLAAMEWVFG
jgi:aminoglycoside phosphotransferase (APT) family kinase protein